VIFDRGVRHRGARAAVRRYRRGVPASSQAPRGPFALLAGLRRELSVPLYRNAYALMANTAGNSVLGLLYWVLAARTFPDAAVGRGNALISLMMLVSTFTQLNWSGALIRFLPRAGRSARQMLVTAYVMATGLAAIAAAAVMAYCHFARPPEDPLHVSAGVAVWFVVSTMAWSVFNLQDAALTGMRSAVWVPLENGLYGLAKLVLLVVVARTSLADGVFASWTIPVIALLVPVNLLLFRRILPGHATAEPDAPPPGRRVLARYMAGDYAAQAFTQLSSTFLPVLVVSLLGAAQGAYYLPAQTAFAAMGMLATAITSSLVVEAARDEQATHRLARAMLRRICVLVLPAGAFVGLAAPWLLELFGSQYRAGATTVLQLMMLSLLPRVPVALYVTKCRLDNRTGTLALLQFTQAALVVGGTAVFAPTAGLVAVGWSVLAAEVVPALAVARPVARWLRG
jgi:O-antigen/teichoic acid export membrane protein